MIEINCNSNDPFLLVVAGNGGNGGIESAEVPDEKLFAVFGRSGCSTCVFNSLGSCLTLFGGSDAPGGAETSSWAAVCVTSSSFCSLSTSTSICKIANY